MQWAHLIITRVVLLCWHWHVYPHDPTQILVAVRKCGIAGVSINLRAYVTTQT